MLNIDSRLRKQVKKLCKKPQDSMWLLEELAERMNKDRECWPCNDTLAEDTGFSVKKVRTLRKELREHNILTWKERIQQPHKYKLPRGINKFLGGQNVKGGQNEGVQNVHPRVDETSVSGWSKRTPEVLPNEVLHIEVLLNKEKQEKEKLQKQLSDARSEIEKLKKEKRDFEKIVEEHGLDGEPPFGEEYTEKVLNAKNQDAEKKEKSCAKKERKLSDKDRPATESRLHDEVIRVLEYLKNKAGYQYRPRKSKYSMDRYGPRNKIVHLLDNGADIMDFKKVIDLKTKEWKGTKKTVRWLNPDTLFGPENFEKYLNQYYQTENINEEPTQATSNKSKSAIRATGNISPEYDQQVNQVLEQYGGTDGTEFLEQWRNSNNKANASRAT